MIPRKPGGRAVRVAVVLLPALLPALVAGGTREAWAAEDRQPAIVAIHVHSTFSNGENTVEEIARRGGVNRPAWLGQVAVGDR